jgi:hypothetical protein
VLCAFEANFMIGLFPSAYQVQYATLRQSLEQAHLAWWKQWEAQRQSEYVIENIRFEHDPQWRHRFFSIQSARDANHWAWKVAQVVVMRDCLNL